MTTQRFSGRQIAVLLFLVVGLAWAVLGRSPARSEPREDPAAVLLADYGGSLAAYQRIFALSDCNALIAEHDLALTNEAREVAGTSAAFVAHGYGRAAAQRMIALDC